MDSCAQMGTEVDRLRVCFQKSKALTGVFCTEGSGSRLLLGFPLSDFTELTTANTTWIWKCPSSSTVQVTYNITNDLIELCCFLSLKS